MHHKVLPKVTAKIQPKPFVFSSERAAVFSLVR